jgi:hypothetical protein
LFGGSSTWTDPKELRYYEFLAESFNASKGFLYVVPLALRDRCLECLKTYFRNSAAIRTGLIVWEDLLDVINDRLVTVALDYVLNTAQALQTLRAWQKSRVS